MEPGSGPGTGIRPQHRDPAPTLGSGPDTGIRPRHWDPTRSTLSVSVSVSVSVSDFQLHIQRYTSIMNAFTHVSSRVCTLKQLEGAPSECTPSACPALERRVPLHQIPPPKDPTAQGSHPLTQVHICVRQVNVLALQSMIRLIPRLSAGMTAVTSTLVPAVAMSLASSNAQVLATSANCSTLLIALHLPHSQCTLTIAYRPLLTAHCTLTTDHCTLHTDH